MSALWKPAMRAVCFVSTAQLARVSSETPLWWQAVIVALIAVTASLGWRE